MTFWWNYCIIELRKAVKKGCDVMSEKFDYSYLRGFIKEHFGSNLAFAKFLGIGTTALYERLSNKVPFAQTEIHKVATESLRRKLTPDEVNLLFFKQ